MMEPFLELFAKAAANMPRLEEALLWVPLVFHPDDEENDESDDENEDVEMTRQGQKTTGSMWTSLLKSSIPQPSLFTPMML